MIILGIGSGLKIANHDSSAALIQNGEVIAAVEDDKVSQKKNSRGVFPKKAIDEVLLIAGLKMEDIDLVCSPLSTYDFYELRLRDLFIYHFGICPKIKLFRHHLCHAASAVLASGENECFYLSMDYSGDNESGIFGRYSLDKGFQDLYVFNNEQSLGFFYSLITQYIGFQAHSDEYKVMGLAPYGVPNLLEKLSRLLQVKRHELFVNNEYNNRVTSSQIHTTDYTTFQEPLFNQAFDDLLKCKRIPGAKIEQFHKDFAASGQKLLEMRVINFLEWQISKRNEYLPLCFAGGVALNCKLTHEIKRTGIFPRVFVQPAAGDSGLALGAALLASEKISNKHFSPFLGRSYCENAIESILKKSKVSFSKCEKTPIVAAKLLANGKMIGWFQGRNEWGPRALGNRSIIANPSIPHIKRCLNQSIKFRESFRPFAPSILSEHAQEVFTDEHADEYMTSLSKVSIDYLKKVDIAGVVHVDNTSRPQIVTKDSNELYWSLINEFYKITGVPLVINTSLNIDGMPIAYSVRDAIRVFYCSGLDYMFIGDYMLSKSNYEQ